MSRWASWIAPGAGWLMFDNTATLEAKAAHLQWPLDSDQLGAISPVDHHATQTRRRQPASSPSKRLFDLCCAGFALLFLLPLLCLIALAIKAESGGPVIFRQQRTGLNNRKFVVLKFRTMTVAEDECEVRQATRADSRVTLIGAALRKLSLDELPQLWNVLRGDMSIVGPRPHAVAHDDYYGQQIPTYRRRFRARPGLTGFAQVNGFRGEIHSMRCMSDRVAADNAYIDQWSTGLDLWIILRTIPLLFHDPNAY